MGKYSRVSDKICKSAVIDEISTGISNAEKEISDIYNNITGLNSPRNCFLYGDSIENFEGLFAVINQSLVNLNDKFSYFKTGLEEIENTSSEQINEIEIPTIHNAELHIVEFSNPTISNTIPVNPSISYEQQNPVYENITSQENTNADLEIQVQLEQDNIETQTMSDSLQDSDDELFASSNNNDENNTNNTNNDSDLSSNNSYNIEFDDSDESSFSKVDGKEEAPVLNDFGTTTESSNNQKTEEDESNGGFNTALAGGIAAAIGAVGVSAAFAHSRMKKNDEKDEDSKRGD